jgi:type 1 fimbriae regulatory protein FimB/type 1 fimbriae regulatory protein FimE
MCRHGLRASEARHTKWNLTPGSRPKTFHIRRLKGSIDSVHTPDRGKVAALRKLKATSTSPYVFVSERGGFHVHPHMLRHATGYALANEGTDTRLIQDFLGHASITDTVRNTKLAPGRLASVRVR